MKVLGISGSPRIGGNTDILLDKALEGARTKGADTEKIVLNNLKFSPCQECKDMKDNEDCILHDDMQKIYEKIRNTDALILASPIFFGSLSAQTKMMIDRFQCIWRAKYILKKDIGFKKAKGAFISVSGADRKDFFDNAKSIVRNLFAVINADYTEELFCPGVDEKGAILRRPDCLKKSFELGARIVG
ncbi:flavodoxin family protein [Candidatus Omnitrophota bacterium]